jgi:hypothetical protein
MMKSPAQSRIIPIPDTTGQEVADQVRENPEGGHEHPGEGHVIDDEALTASELTGEEGGPATAGGRSNGPKNTPGRTA